MAVREITISSTWDSEAEVWFATSEDVPGLVLEAETLDGIIEEARSLVPELLRLSGVTGDTTASLLCKIQPSDKKTRYSCPKNKIASHRHHILKESGGEKAF